MPSSGPVEREEEDAVARLLHAVPIDAEKGREKMVACWEKRPPQQQAGNMQED